MTKALKEDEIVLTEEQQEQMYWSRYKFDSHRWVEYAKGYYQCSFCGRQHTSAMPINFASLCQSNPHLKD